MADPRDWAAPDAVLAALIIHAVSRLWKVAVLRRVYAERRVEFARGLATLLGVLMLGVLAGLVIGVVAMLLLLVYNASRPHVAVLGRLPGEAGAFAGFDRHPEAEPVAGVLILRLKAPLVYRPGQRPRQAARRGGGPDAAGLDFAVADVRDRVIERARLTGLLAAIGQRRVFHTLEQAVEEVEAGAAA